MTNADFIDLGLSLYVGFIFGVTFQFFVSIPAVLVSDTRVCCLVFSSSLGAFTSERPSIA